MTDIICITCPRGCRLKVDEENGYAVTGNACPRGAVYGYNEITNPTRVVTSTVRTDSEETPRCPVKTDGAIPKGKMFEVMRLLDSVVLKTPVKLGEVVIPNVLGTGIDVITCKAVK